MTGVMTTPDRQPIACEIRLIDAASTGALRQAVLRPHQTLAECVYPGDNDETSFHYGAFHDDQLVTIASVNVERETRFEQFPQTRQLRLRGMATDPSCRGHGFGKAVLQRCLAHAWSTGAELLWCNARTTAAGYYERMGFLVIPDTFELPAIGPHRVMYITPDVDTFS